MAIVVRSVEESYKGKGTSATKCLSQFFSKAGVLFVESQLGTLLTDMLRALARIGFTNRNAISSKGKKPSFVAYKFAIQ
jgi:hypothetical protein